MAQRLNMFQRLARQWSIAHPFNGAQVVVLAEEARVCDWESAWRSACRTLGIQDLVAGENARLNSSFDDKNVQNSVRKTLDVPIECVINDGMNERLELTTGRAILPFVGTTANEFYTGILYEHWIADSASIRKIMRAWLDAALDRQGIRHPRVLRRPAGGLMRYFGPQTGIWRPVGSLLDACRFIDQMRRVRAHKIVEAAPMRTGYLLANGPDGLVDTLRRTARNMGVKVNDLFVAAAMEAIASEMPIESRARRRRNWAIGSIVDLRRLADELDDVFGNFLGFTAAIARPGDVRDWERLVATVARQSRRDKTNGTAAASCMMMAVAVGVRSILSDRKTAHFCRIHAPLTAGVSNVNLTGMDLSPVIDWVRASPCGPMAPLVFAVTTLANKLSIGVTYRESIVDRPTAQRITAAFLKRLASL
jgi:hypothetical protein